MAGFLFSPKAFSLDKNEAGILVYSGELQLELGELDHLGRATSAHIQLNASHAPKKQREPRIKYNPVGWHNYKFYFGDGHKKAWLMNRGHLVGFQFGGLNDEPKNLVPMTSWLNSGNYVGFDDSNADSMLYYENRLDSWLENHPNAYLDYRVVPVYTGDELLPRQIELTYVGLDESGKLLPIGIGGKSEQNEFGVSRVLLENISPNAQIDYLSGKAENITLPVENDIIQQVETTHSEQTVSDVSQVNGLAEVVYVAQYGKSTAYWYHKENMPLTTNFNKVITMTESEALARGKHHSSKE